MIRNIPRILGIKNNRLLGNSFATLRSKLLLVSFGIGFMISAMALVSRSIGQGRIGLAKEQAVSCMLMSVFLQCCIAIVFILFTCPCYQPPPYLLLGSGG